MDDGGCDIKGIPNVSESKQLVDGDSCDAPNIFKLMNGLPRQG